MRLLILLWLVTMAFPLAAQSPELVQAKAKVKALAEENIGLDKTFQAELEKELKSSYDMGPKGEFETTAEYDARLKLADAARQRLAPEYARKKADRRAVIEGELASLTSRPWSAPIRIRLGAYDADKQVFPFYVKATKDSGSIEIPREVAREIKTNLGTLKQTGWWRLSTDFGAELAAVAVNHGSGTYLGQTNSLNQFKLVKTLTGHSSYVNSVAFSPDGELLASGSLGGTVYLRRVTDGTLQKTILGHSGGVYSVAFSPDGELLASGSVDNTIKLWRTANGKLVNTFSGHLGDVYSVAFSPDGELLASGSGDKTIKLWRTASGNLVNTFAEHSGWVFSVAYSPDGQLIASGSGDETIKLWRVANGTLVRTFSGHTGAVSSVAFSPDGELVASSGRDKTIKLWRVANGQLVRTISGHSNAVNSVAFSPDGELLASGSRDKTIKLWRVADGKLIKTFSGHLGVVFSVAFSPKGELLASSSDDKTVKLWQVGERPLDSQFLAAIQTGGGVTGSPGSTRLPPHLSATAEFNEPSGDNMLSGGEEATLALVVINSGQGAAQGIEIRLTTDAKGLSFATSRYVGVLGAGESRQIKVPITGSRTLASGEAKVTVTFTEARGFEPGPIEVTFTTLAYRPPLLVVADVGIDDASGNGMIEPGEVVSIVIRAQNRGRGQAERVSGRITLGKDVFLAGESKTVFDIGLLAPGESVDLEFELYTNRRAKTIDVSVSLTEATGNHGMKATPLDLPFNSPLKSVQQVVIEGREAGAIDYGADGALSSDIETDIPWGAEQRKDGMALIIANRNYRNKDVPTVAYAHRDGELMKRYLTQVLGYREGNILVEYDATLATFRTALAKLKNGARPEGDIFVYYTGHGAPDPESDSGYFVPVDTDPNYVAIGGLSLNDFYRAIDAIEARTKTVVIDACFSGGSDQGMIIRNISPVYLEINREGLTTGTAFTSSSGNEVSSWYPEMKHSLYTYYFLKGLGGEADVDADGSLTAGELQVYLMENVPYMARRLNNRQQTPQLTKSGDSVLLVRYRQQD